MAICNHCQTEQEKVLFNSAMLTWGVTYFDSNNVQNVEHLQQLRNELESGFRAHLNNIERINQNNSTFINQLLLMNRRNPEYSKENKKLLFAAARGFEPHDKICFTCYYKKIKAILQDNQKESAFRDRRFDGDASSSQSSYVINNLRIVQQSNIDLYKKNELTTAYKLESLTKKLNIQHFFSFLLTLFVFLKH